MTIETTPPVRSLAPAARAVDVLGGDLTEASLRRYLEGIPGVDAVGLEQRAAGLGTRSIKTTSKRWALDKIIELIDLTTLEGADTPGKVRSLVAKALTPDPGDLTTPRVAAVCVYGDMVPYRRRGARRRARRRRTPAASTSPPSPPPSPAGAPPSP